MAGAAKWEEAMMESKGKRGVTRRAVTEATLGIAGAVAFVFAAGAFAPAALAESYTMKIGLVTINDPQHTFVKKYKEELEKRTKGRIQVKIFPAAQLGKIPRQLEGLQLGTQEGFQAPPGFLSGMNQAFQAPDAPALFKSFWQAQRALTNPQFRDRYLKLAEKNGIIGVSLWTYGPTSIASHKPIRTIADMKGLKIRVLATKMESRIASEMGMTGVPMPFSEVLPALQRKTIDGCRTSIVVMGALKFFTSTKYITKIESGMIPSALWVSKKWLDKLPKDLQQAVVKTGRDLEGWAGKNSEAFEKRAVKLWTDNGAEVITLAPKEREKIFAKLRPLGDEVLGKNPKTKEMYTLLKAVVAKTPK
jgi:TRAP-type transport system periplasmic protein